MRHPFIIAFLIIGSMSSARADMGGIDLVTPLDTDAQWRTAAETQLRQRLRTEWDAVVAAPTWSAWAIDMGGGKRFSGDRAVEVGGWTYFLSGDKLRCQMQPGKPSHVSCGGGDYVDREQVRVAMRASAQPRTLATLVRFHRAVFGNNTLAMKIDGDKGRATLETTVSMAPAPTRMSRRYRADVVFSTGGFALAVPQLVEQYNEQCMGVHGCYEIHWNCQRSM